MTWKLLSRFKSFPKIDFECHEWEYRMRFTEKRKIAVAQKHEKVNQPVQESDEPQSTNTAPTTVLIKRDPTEFMGKILENSLCSIHPNDLKRTKNN